MVFLIVVVIGLGFVSVVVMCGYLTCSLYHVPF